MAADTLADVLGEFAQTMLTDFPIQRILDELVERIVVIMPVTAAGVTLISPGTEPQYVAASNPSALRFEQLQTELDEGPCVAAYRTGEAISVPDLGVDARFPNFAPRALEAGMAAVFTFPLRHGESRPLGALDLYRDEPGGLSAEAMATAQTLANVVSAYLINATAREELQRTSDRSSAALLHDALTGLPNRTLLLERLGHASLTARRSDAASALLFIDLDHFKVVNDAYGHRTGDELLVALAERMTGALRPGDTLARLAGDEFAVLCEDVGEEAVVEEIVARLHRSLDRPFTLSGGEVSITASIGMVMTGARGGTPHQLLHEADLAMYASKRRSRDRAPADADAVASGYAHGRDDLAADLDGAVERAELQLAYQPIVRAANGRIAGLEALVRWTHPRLGPIPPETLIPLAERSGQITGLGHWVLERALADHQHWQADRAEPLALSVNVSAHQLVSPGFSDTVATVLQTTGSDPRLLTLELTETAFARDAERALTVLHELKDLGVTLAIDDFGTGYSALTYLTRYPVDDIKIDRAFTAGLGPTRGGGIVLAALIQLAHGLGLTVVCEGVETAEQHVLVRDLGCDRCQGFHFAPAHAGPSLQALIRPDRSGRNARLPVSD